MKGLIALLLFLAASLYSINCHAHLTGFVDTGVQLSQRGVQLIYTLPQSNLVELYRLKNRNPLANPSAQAYLNFVTQGWKVFSNGRNCRLDQASAESVMAISAYQYHFSYACPQGMEQVRLEYQLFDPKDRSHHNFVQVLMAGQTMRTRFSFDRQFLVIPVAELLTQWGVSLNADFEARDINQDLHTTPTFGMRPEIDGVLPTSDNPTDDLHAVSSPWDADPTFIWLGVQHIWQGLDHTLFLVALLMLPAGWRRLLLWISCFTVAHSITLSLAYFQIVQLSPAVTEPLIAMTLIAIGAENFYLMRRHQLALKLRPLLIFIFGLVHGIGLSYQLTAMSDGSVGRLLWFNLGVELGQLSVVGLLLWPLYRLFARVEWRQVSRWVSALVMAAGGYWLVLRVI